MNEQERQELRRIYGEADEYPDHPIIKNVPYPQNVIDAMMMFRRMHMFKPKDYSEENLAEKRRKYTALLSALSDCYGLPTPIVRDYLITPESWKKVGNGFYNPATNTITFYGKYSMITALHEFAHSLGLGEEGAVCYSVNLFRMIYPRASRRCVADQHMMIQNDQQINALQQEAVEDEVEDETA